MRVALFVPCYVDQLFPHVAVASLELLEKLGCEVVYPLDQTCCGQPMANSGFEKEGDAALSLFEQNFAGFEYIVSPSGSCVLHVKDHASKDANSVRTRVYELAEFLVDVLKVEKLPARFSGSVGLHQSCHGLRGLRLGKSSELMGPADDKVKKLLGLVKGLQLVDLNRGDECCGFGGTFAVTEEAISVKMGRDRLKDHLSNGAEIITGTDMSCIMHLQGLATREKQHVRFMHLAEILNEGW
ncbi:MAG: (Fe-S)-binding protein [Rhodothermales bacterium]